MTSDRLGAQNALLGGGRYDDLVADLGGPPTPAVGFAIGEDRLVEAMTSDARPPRDSLRRVPDGREELVYALGVADEIRRLLARGRRRDATFSRRGIGKGLGRAGQLAADASRLRVPDRRASSAVLLGSKEREAEIGDGQGPRDRSAGDASRAASWPSGWRGRER